MSLFTKPINDITYDDVVAFCEESISENVNLDYKQDFPEKGKLEKTISAFANTYGGIIIIGIADEDSKPKPPFEGIQYKEKLEERVWSIILDNIYPPLFPEIRVCPPKNNKTFVVIRVQESNETPHAIYNNTDVYIRTGNRNTPEEKATEEKREWLRNRRKKSEVLRWRLYRKAKQRYDNICKQKKLKAEFGEFTISFCPLYPQKPLMSTVKNIDDFLLELETTNPYGCFPRMIESSMRRGIQDGMYYFGVDEHTKFFTYSEINKFGLIFYKEDAGWYYSEKKTKRLYGKHLMGTLVLALEVAHKFYERVGYFGLLEISVSLNRLMGVEFVRIVRRGSTEEYTFDSGNARGEINDTDEILSWQFIFNAAHLKDLEFRKQKLLEFGEELHWSFGVKINESILREYIVSATNESGIKKT